MNIKEIYEAFDQIGCLTFTTVDETGTPISRIAHLRGYDEQGLYFMSMFTKDFYAHIKKNGKCSICGLNANSKVKHQENGFPVFDKGYSIRLTGNVKEVAIEEIIAKNNPMFDFCIKDQQKYPAMVVLCISDGYGDIFDYDFEKQERDHKLERTYFSFHQEKISYRGLTINQEKCIGCGLCQKKCSFSAINHINGQYVISNTRCDECGDCFVNCPVKAITHRQIDGFNIV